ncbi:MAG: 23S rRNA (cytidine(2498)-2'-O)-methyltransferase RlmM [Xanthomonadaceae bacterium]|nr:23S rRNA (cytidine(2498)-2'-O)-methyltransferase RlmM [Xanthomonadaceae bacterium]MDE2257622.1 23S rRNA (cytidine(2498)-2'-O)-methyltransferase RlmM [Xanthomonadaceae bacterium]
MNERIKTVSAAFVLYCRAGFESECAQEVAALGAGETVFARDSGFVVCRSALHAGTVHWRDLIFARQALPVIAHLLELSRGDRLTPILAALTPRGEPFNDVWVEAPDTNAGKQLAAFCKSFNNAMVGAMKKAQLLDTAAPRRLHAFFPQSDEVYLCAADPDTCAPWAQGIPRLKFPRAAPSRSTLKLEEGLLTLLDESERARWLKPGMSAVDLGAAPGGWTYQLVRRSLRVTAIDNGPMDRALLDSGLVTHRREDGFRYRPPKPVDWLVCDMVEQPRRVADLAARWLQQGWCRHALFNLKLPMKKRFDEAQQCLARVRTVAREVRAKQLYHDREEITVFAQDRR